MAAAADDDDVVVGLRLGLAPGRLPARVAAKSLSQQRKDGIFHLARQPLAQRSRRAARVATIDGCAPSRAWRPCGERAVDGRAAGLHLGGKAIRASRACAGIVETIARCRLEPSMIMLHRRDMLLGLLAGTLACRLRRSAQSKEPILIGVTGPLTGQYAQYGAQWKKGFDVALDEINARGRHQRTAARLRVRGQPERSAPDRDDRAQIRRGRAHRGRGRRLLQRRPRWRPRRSTRRRAWCSSASPTRTRISPRAATSSGATPSTRRTRCRCWRTSCAISA